MKKYIYYLLISSLAIILSNCTDILDTTPRNLLTDVAVWSSPDAIQAYMAQLYDKIPSDDLGYTVIDEAGFPSQVTDEAVRSYTWGNINNPLIPDNGFSWWEYGFVREANIFIEKIKTAPIDEDEKRIYEAEARFVRAFYYFGMVKRYGGVPLLTQAQEYTGGNVEDLWVPRNTEKEIYDFICTEIDAIVSVLPESWDNNNRFRATRYSAYALKSRAMLYAASIAAYGRVELGGLVGIPSSDKTFYWKECVSACEAIMNSGQFALYNMTADRTENFQTMFLDKSKHSEDIYTRGALASDKAHNFDYYNAPQSFKVNYGCVTNPVLELVESYEYMDGSPGQLKVNDQDGNPILFSDPTELFKDKDPRLLATVMVPFSDWQGGYIEIRKGIIDGEKIITASNLRDTYGSGANQITIIGKDGALDTNDPTKTGFYIKKFMNPTERLSSYRSDTYWRIFRYGEILLNYAEACAELGENERALIAVNQIRERAGIKRKTSVSVEDVRHERRVELAFENHRWWDLRRWRIADQVLDNTQFHSLYPYLVWEEGKHPSEMKYIFKIQPTPKNPRTFLPKLYYVKISDSQIQTNPLLVQNPGY